MPFVHRSVLPSVALSLCVLFSQGAVVPAGSRTIADDQGSEHWLEAFSELPEPERRQALPRLLGELDQAAEQRDHPRAKQMARVITTLGQHAVRPLIQRCEVQSDGSLPAAAWPAIDALGDLGPSAQDALQPLIGLMVADVVGGQKQHERLISVLRSIEPNDQRLTNLLLPAMKSKSAPFLADLLAHMGPSAEEAVPHLVPLLRDKELRIAGTAARALLCVAPEDKELHDKAQTAFWRALRRTSTENPFEPWAEFEFLATIVAVKPKLFESEMLRRLKTGDHGESMRILTTWTHVGGELPQAAVPAAVRLIETPTDMETKVAAMRFVAECRPGSVKIDLNEISRQGLDRWAHQYLKTLLYCAEAKVELKAVRKLLARQETCELGLLILEQSFTDDVAEAELLNLLERIEGWQSEQAKLGLGANRPLPVDLSRFKADVAWAIGNRGSVDQAVKTLAKLYAQSRPTPSITSGLGEYGLNSTSMLRIFCVSQLARLGRRGADVEEHLVAAFDDPELGIRMEAADGLLSTANAKAYQARIERMCLDAIADNDSNPKMLSLWWRSSSGESRHRCLKACRQALSQPHPRMLQGLHAFQFGPDCEPLLNDLLRIMREGATELDYRVAAGQAVLRIAPRQVAARDFLIQRAQQEVADAQTAPLLPYDYCFGCNIWPFEAETTVIFAAGEIDDPRVDALLRDAIQSRRTDLRRAAARVRS